MQLFCNLMFSHAFTSAQRKANDHGNTVSPTHAPFAKGGQGFRFFNFFFGVYFFKDFIYLFLDRGEGKEKEASMCSCLSCVPYWGPGAQLRHVPLTGYRTGDPSVHRPALNPLSHTSQGQNSNIFFTLKSCLYHLVFWGFIFFY